MRGKRGGLSPLAAGVIVAVAAVIITYFGFTKAVPFQHHFSIKAAFTSANNIKKGSPVRIAGVNVGKVSGISFLGKGQSAAVVSMRIDNQGLPIHKDATAKIRQRIFLEGNFFVDVNPGTPSAPTLGDGDMIPVQQTSDPVQLDQVLSVLPTATRADLQQLLRDLSTGLSGKGAAGFNQSIPYWAPAYRSNSIVNDALLGTAQHDLSNYIKSSSAVAQATDQSPAALQGLIRDFNITANALAVQNADLAAAIHELPNTLRVGQPALAAVNAALPSVNAFAADLRPGVRSSVPTLNASQPLIHQLRLLVQPSELRGLVHDLRPTVPALAQLNVSSVPLLGQVRAASSCQNTVILPWSHNTLKDPNFPATGPVYQEGVKYLPGLGGESRSFDANGRWFRVLLVAPAFMTPAPAGQVLLTTNQVSGVNPPQGERPPLRSDAPCETQQPPNLETAVGAPPPGQQPITPPTNPLPLKIEARAQTEMIKWARQIIKTNKLQNVLRVTNTPITAKDIPRLRSMAGK